MRCLFCFSHLLCIKVNWELLSEMIRQFAGTLCDAWLQTGGLGSWQWPGGKTSYLSHPLIIDHRDDAHLMINIMAMTGRNQRGEEGLQPGRLQEHEGHVSLPFLLICI